MLGFVTDSPLFDNPAGFYPGATTHEEDIRRRAAAQRAMEAGRPMTIREMYGKDVQLFRSLNGFGTIPGVAGGLVRSIIMGGIMGVIVGGGRMVAFDKASVGAVLKNQKEEMIQFAMVGSVVSLAMAILGLAVAR